MRNTICEICRHTDVCKYRESIDIVFNISDMNPNFACKFFMTDSHNNTLAVKEPQAKDQFPNLTVDELAKKIQAQKEKPVKTGTCDICGRKNVTVYTCDECGRTVCGNCVESEVSARLDPITGDITQTERYICTDCQTNKEKS